MAPCRLLLLTSACLALTNCSPTPDDIFARAGSASASVSAGKASARTGSSFASAGIASARAGSVSSSVGAGTVSVSASGDSVSSSAFSSGSSAGSSSDDYYDYNDYNDFDYEPVPPALSFAIFDDTAARFPASEEAPSPTLSPCTWAVVNCCSNADKWGSRIQCFERQGCTGAWFEDLCTPSVKRGVFQQVFGSIQG